jgi:hypothetical protein
MGLNHLYARQHPNKSAWEERHHFARFIAQAYNLARVENTEWTAVHDEDQAIPFWQLYEVPCFLIQFS